MAEDSSSFPIRVPVVLTPPLGNIISSSFPPPKQRKFLYYYSHSGFGNQLLGLLRAAQLAHATHRVLILPPVLPFNGNANDKVEKFLQWPARGVGKLCKAVQHYAQQSELAIQDVSRVLQQQQQQQQHQNLMAASNNNNYTNLDYYEFFPSYQQFMDITAENLPLGLEMMDLPEFIRSPWYIPTEQWCHGSIHAITLTRGKKGKCRVEYGAYEEFLQALKNQLDPQGTRHNQNCQVLVMGSAFALQHNSSKSNVLLSSTLLLLHDFVMGFVPPRHNHFLEIVQRLYQKLPQDYIGVHVRVGDEIRPNNPCGDGNGARRNLYQQLVDQMLLQQEEEANASGRPKNITTTTTTTILIGRVNRFSKSCLEHSIKELLPSNHPRSFQVTTVQELLAAVHSNKERRWINQIPLEPSELHLLLDQILIALASRVYMTSTLQSTFQQIIQGRHQLRHKSLSQITPR